MTVEVQIDTHDLRKYLGAAHAENEKRTELMAVMEQEIIRLRQELAEALAPPPKKGKK